ncbi:AMP-binding protein [Salibacterium qingdaonense]|uniref:Long-chain acyl-CoA synthetase n=1 Tax=Salibacterium qingdaonense TaxID=266892 RepID=A0A1I4IR18_9BACI|nr:AMP-binding protein [Salibacterium qingdaonense]SFL56433.1 long-chain acyl-CoA synthetase [Salibacterium qingdaonense]
MSIAASIRENAKYYPDKTAVFCDGRAISYQELEDTTNCMAQWMHQKERKAGNGYSKAAVLLPNSPEFLEIVLGTAKAGWMVVTLDPKWSSEEITAVLKQTEPDYLFLDSTYDAYFSEWQKVTRIISLHVGVKEVPTDERPWDAAENIDVPLSEELPMSLFYMGFTSGSTGMPKGFIRTQQSWMTSFQEGDRELKIRRLDKVVVPGPLVHSLFLFAALHTLHAGAVCYIESSFQAERLLERCRQESITVMYGVPTMYEALGQIVEREHSQNMPLYKCIISGDRCSPAALEKLRSLFPGAEWMSFYGSSELSFVAICKGEDVMKRTSALGYPFSTVEFSIRDERGREVQPGEAGELFVKSPMVFSGYEHEPFPVPKKWIPSGDIVREEKDGLLCLVGRRKNKIISGGLNIFPEEVETLLNSHPSVKETAVTGLTDEYWGEIAAACIEPSSGVRTETLHLELKHYCRKYTASYKCPKQWVMIEEMPLTTSGKPARKKAAALIKKKGVKI